MFRSGESMCLAQPRPSSFELIWTGSKIRQEQKVGREELESSRVSWRAEGQLESSPGEGCWRAVRVLESRRVLESSRVFFHVSFIYTLLGTPKLTASYCYIQFDSPTRTNRVISRLVSGQDTAST